MNHVLRLPETLDTAGALALRDDLLALRQNAAHIDASAVAKMNGLAAEILLSAHLQWQEDGADLVITDTSEAFAATLSDLGLADAIGLPADAGGGA